MAFGMNIVCGNGFSLLYTFPTNCMERVFALRKNGGWQIFRKILQVC